jgi:hypothetical protein
MVNRQVPLAANPGSKRTAENWRWNMSDKKMLMDLNDKLSALKGKLVSLEKGEVTNLSSRAWVICITLY